MCQWNGTSFLGIAYFFIFFTNKNTCFSLYFLYLQNSINNALFKQKINTFGQFSMFLNKNNLARVSGLALGTRPQGNSLKYKLSEKRVA